jgi:alkanesulfonate monooxygenase SsuD/methylene tetrahydromethanopterin reductase-like flavin-dependent oxidoreductase (luciferase family)
MSAGRDTADAALRTDRTSGASEASTPRRRNNLHGPNWLRLGIFGANCSSGLAVTTVPERWDATWENNEAVARLADAAGIEFMLPIARWRGYGGTTDFQSSTFETITWACGLLAATANLTVFGTVHVPLISPIVAAKQIVTVDHMSRGRFGLNIVCGWNADEFEMFSQALREHDDRYVFGQEWLDVVLGVWEREQPFDYHGQFIRVKGATGSPKPWGGGRPVLMNAGASVAGRSFGARNCDFLFTIVADLEKAPHDVAEIKRMAVGLGREDLGVLTTSYVVCRSSQREADDYHHYYAVEKADGDAVEHLMKLQGLHTKGRPPELQQKFKERFAGGHGSFPLVGSPDHVAAQLGRIAAAGFAGTTLSFVDYRRELPFFVAEVLPRLERAGLRVPTRRAIESTS